MQHLRCAESRLSSFCLSVCSGTATDSPPPVWPVNSGRGDRTTPEETHRGTTSFERSTLTLRLLFALVPDVHSRAFLQITARKEINAPHVKGPLRMCRGWRMRMVLMLKYILAEGFKDTFLTRAHTSHLSPVSQRRGL